MGSSAGYGILNGDYNTCVGVRAGYHLDNDAQSNIMIGRRAGYNVDGNHNVIIGSKEFASSGETFSDTIIVSAGTTERLRINSTGITTFTGIVNATGFYVGGSQVAGTTINNNANNRLITGSGTANTLEAESTLTYDGTELKLADQKRLAFGNSGDLKIEHDGGNSFIDEAGTGKLLIRTNSRVDITSTSNYSMLEMIVGGAVQAYHNGTKKFETTSDGVKISGTLTVDGEPFIRNKNAITASVTLTTAHNHMSAGPITINSGVTVTVNSGATWTVV